VAFGIMPRFALANAGVALQGVTELPRWLARRRFAVLADVGFTMALFVARPPFADPAGLDAARFGGLAGSAQATVAGLGLGRAEIAQSADEADARRSSGVRTADRRALR
jgi:Na+/H+ antiporter NhaA